MSSKNDFIGDYSRYENTLHKVLIEFVSVPSTFDIEYYLSIMESTGNFKNDSIKIKEIKFLVDVIKESPQFILSSPSAEKAASMLFILNILNFAKLTIQGMSNFINADPKLFDNYLNNINFRGERAGQQRADMTIIIINVYKWIEDNMLTPVIDMVVKSEKYINEMKSTDELFK